MRIERKTVMDDIFGRPGKRCAMCGQYKEHNQFNFSRLSNDGLQCYCKDCQKKYREMHPYKQYKKMRKDESLTIWNEKV